MKRALIAAALLASASLATAGHNFGGMRYRDRSMDRQPAQGGGLFHAVKLQEGALSAAINPPQSAPLPQAQDIDVQRRIEAAAAAAAQLRRQQQQQQNNNCPVR